MDEYEKVREALSEMDLYLTYDGYLSSKDIGQILSIEGIAILADDQSLPDNPYRLARKYNLSYACKLVQQDMLQAGFLKVVKKEG